MPLTSIATSATLAPRVEVYTILACAVHKPDILRQSFPEIALGHRVAFRDFRPIEISFPESHPLLNYRSFSEADPPNQNLCATDPVVQAATAKLIAGQILVFIFANLLNNVYSKPPFVDTVVSACTGVLSLLTTGWWSSVSHSSLSAMMEPKSLVTVF